MLQQFVGARYFTILDTKSRFWQLELQKLSQSLTAIATMFFIIVGKLYPFGSPVAQISLTPSSKSSTRK